MFCYGNSAYQEPIEYWVQRYKSYYPNTAYHEIFTKKKKLHTVEFDPPWETNWNKIILDSLPKEYNNVMKWSAHTAWTPTKISHIPTQRMPNIIDAGI